MLHNFIYLLANDLYHTLRGQEFTENPNLEFQPIWNLEPEYCISEPLHADGYIPCLDLYLRTVKTPTSAMKFMLVRCPRGNRKPGLLSGILNNLLSNPGKVLGLSQPDIYQLSAEVLSGLTAEQTTKLISAIQDGKLNGVVTPEVNLNFVTPWYRLPNHVSVGYSYMTPSGRINFEVLLEQSE